MALFTIRTIVRAVERDACTDIGNRLAQDNIVKTRIACRTVAKLPDDAHFSGSVLANANRLCPGFEFLPTSFPVNHWHEAVER